MQITTLLTNGCLKKVNIKTKEINVKYAEFVMNYIKINKNRMVELLCIYLILLDFVHQEKHYIS